MTRQYTDADIAAKEREGFRIAARILFSMKNRISYEKRDDVEKVAQDIEGWAGNLVDWVTQDLELMYADKEANTVISEKDKGEK